MRYLKKKNYDGSIRKVVSDVGGMLYGIVGMVGDLLECGVLEYCDFNRDSWCFIPTDHAHEPAWFGKTRDEALEHLIKNLEG